MKVYKTLLLLFSIITLSLISNLTVCFGMNVKISKTDKFFPNSEQSCRYCGCRRFLEIKDYGKNKVHIQVCVNCKKSSLNEEKLRNLIQPTKNQLWKECFCDTCGSLNGFVIMKYVNETQKAQETSKLSRENIIKNLLTYVDGFYYYCYKCKDITHIILDKKEFDIVCRKYSSCVHE